MGKVVRELSVDIVFAYVFVKILKELALVTK
jgi:hypothetical protein